MIPFFGIYYPQDVVLSVVVGIVAVVAVYIFLTCDTRIRRGAEHLVVCGFGHPLLDIQSHVSQLFLAKYNLSPGDTTLAGDVHKGLAQELSQRPDVRMHAGGATLNAVRVCGWMLRDSPGEAPAYGGCIGNDKFGEILKSHCSFVRTFFEVSDSYPTGTCSCCIAAKDRTLVADLAAAQHFHCDFLTQLEELLDSVDIFYIAGFFLNLIPQNNGVFPALLIAEKAFQSDKILCMNLSAAYLCTNYQEQWALLLPFIDYLFGNEDDFRGLAAAFKWENLSTQQIANQVAQWDKLSLERPRTVIVTRGSKSTLVCTSSKPGCCVEFKTPLVHAAHIRDVNGAGDAFVGGFLSQLAQRRGISESLRAGQYAASQIIRQAGCSIPEGPAKFRYTGWDHIVDCIRHLDW